MAQHDIEAGEQTPLIARSDAPHSNADDEPPPLKDMKAHSLREQLVAGAAVISFSSSVASMLVETAPTVYVSGAIGAGIAPYAAMQQRKITEVEALKQTNERMGEEVAQLQQENQRLQTQVTELESSVLNLQEMQKTLETIRAVEGQSIDELERQLQESREILEKTEDNLQADILQNLITVVLACDDNGDMTLADAEINEMILNIEGMEGVDLKEDLLRTKLIEQGRSMTAVMDVIKNLLSDDIPEEENIFHFIEAPSKK